MQGDRGRLLGPSVAGILREIAPVRGDGGRSRDLLQQAGLDDNVEEQGDKEEGVDGEAEEAEAAEASLNATRDRLHAKSEEAAALALKAKRHELRAAEESAERERAQQPLELRQLDAGARRAQL